MVRGKAPLDPPYLPPSGQGGLSQSRESKREEGEGETNTGGFFPVSRPDVRTAAAHHQFEKRHLSNGIQLATECVCL